MLHEAYGDDTLSQMTTYKWFKRFKNGRTWMDDDDERTSTSRSRPLIAQVKNITVEIIEWLTEILQKRLEHPLVHDTLLIKDLGMHLSQQNLCQNSWLMIRNCNELPSVKISPKCH
jgi:hypothetical protein